MHKFRIDLRFPAFGGGGNTAPPPPPAVPKTPISPDTSKLKQFQRRTGNARGIASTIKSKGQTLGGDADKDTTGGFGSFARALKALTGL